MFCSQCGSLLMDDAKFCSQCGSPVKRAEPTETGRDARAFPEFVFPEEEAEPSEEPADDAEALTAEQNEAAEVGEGEPAEPAAECGEPTAKPPVSDRYIPEFEAVWEVPQKMDTGKPTGWGAENHAEDQDAVEAGADAPEKPKKKHAPLIAALVVLAVLVLIGGMFAYFSLIDDREDKGVFSIFDVSKDENKLDKELEKAFLDLVSRWDSACKNESVYLFSRAFPEYAHDYILQSYNVSSVEGILSWMHYMSFGKCGEDSVFTETYEVEQKIESTDLLGYAIERVTNQSAYTGFKLQVEEAYLIRNTTTVEGSKDKLLLTDLYLFYKVDDVWYLILVKDPKDFDL